MWNRKIFSVSAIALLLAACSGGDEDSVTADIASVPVCIATAGSSGSCGSGDSSSSTTGTTGSDTTGDPLIDNLNIVLNPDNCSEAQLGALDLLSGLTAEEIQSQVGTRLIIGTVTYDRVPQLETGSLDYSNITSQPAYGSGIVATACSGTVVSTDGIESDGSYVLRVPINVDVSLTVVSLSQQEAFSDEYSSFIINVFDNTDSNSTYSFPVTPTGASSSVIEGNQTTVVADVHVDSGWSDADGAYTARQAAPLAIAHTVAKVMDLMTVPSSGATGPGKRGAGEDFGEIQVGWSASNTTTDGVEGNGEIGESHYDSDQDIIYLLGKSGVNTDEFDELVIARQMAKWFIAKKSRNDSLPGEHEYDGDLLDPRVSFYEGFAIGLASGISGDAYYVDSKGEQATTPDSVSINVENGTLANTGSYIEGSVAQIVHDVLDSGANDLDGDGLSVLYYEVIDALTEASTTPSMMTIYAFVSALKRTVYDEFEPDDGGYAAVEFSPAETSALDGITTSQSIAVVSEDDDYLDDSDEIDQFKSDYPAFDEFNAITWGGKVGQLDIDTANLPGSFARGETNNGGATTLGSADIIFKHMGVFGGGNSPTDPTVFAGEKVLDEVCTIDDFGVGNKFGNRRLIAFTVFDKNEFEATSDWRDTKPDLFFDISQISGDATVIPSVKISKTGGEVVSVVHADGVSGQNFQLGESLSPGAYVLELSTIANAGAPNATSADACFKVIIDDTKFSVRDE